MGLNRGLWSILLLVSILALGNSCRGASPADSQQQEQHDQQQQIVLEPNRQVAPQFQPGPGIISNAQYDVVPTGKFKNFFSGFKKKGKGAHSAGYQLSPPVVPLGEYANYEGQLDGSVDIHSLKGTTKGLIRGPFEYEDMVYNEKVANMMDELNRGHLPMPFFSSYYLSSRPTYHLAQPAPMIRFPQHEQPRIQYLQPHRLNPAQPIKSPAQILREADNGSLPAQSEGKQQQPIRQETEQVIEQQRLTADGIKDGRQAPFGQSLFPYPPVNAEYGVETALDPARKFIKVQQALNRLATKAKSKLFKGGAGSLQAAGPLPVPVPVPVHGQRLVGEVKGEAPIQQEREQQTVEQQKLENSFEQQILQTAGEFDERQQYQPIQQQQLLDDQLELRNPVNNFNAQFYQQPQFEEPIQQQREQGDVKGGPIRAQIPHAAPINIPDQYEIIDPVYKFKQFKLLVHQLAERTKARLIGAARTALLQQQVYLPGQGQRFVGGGVKGALPIQQEKEQQVQQQQQLEDSSLSNFESALIEEPLKQQPIVQQQQQQEFIQHLISKTNLSHKAVKGEQLPKAQPGPSADIKAPRQQLPIQQTKLPQQLALAPIKSFRQPALTQLTPQTKRKQVTKQHNLPPAQVPREVYPTKQEERLREQEPIQQQQQELREPTQQVRETTIHQQEPLQQQREEPANLQPQQQQIRDGPQLNEQQQTTNYPPQEEPPQQQQQELAAAQEPARDQPVALEPKRPADEAQNQGLESTVAGTSGANSPSSDLSFQSSSNESSSLGTNGSPLAPQPAIDDQSGDHLIGFDEPAGNGNQNTALAEATQETLLRPFVLAPYNPLQFKPERINKPASRSAGTH